MLPSYYRFIVKNYSGQAITYNTAGRIALRWEPWKRAVDGVVIRGSVVTDAFGFVADSTLADGAIKAGTAIDNRDLCMEGGNGQLQITHDVAAADGNILLYLEASLDGVNWPSDNCVATIFASDPSLYCTLVKTCDLDNTDVDQAHCYQFSVSPYK